MADWSKVWATTKQGEGGYTDNPKDAGNYTGGVVGKGMLSGTNHGISAVLYSAYIGRPATVADMKNMSVATAEKVWKKYYWDAIDGDNIPSQKLAELYIYSVGGGSSGWLHIRQAANKVSGKKLFNENKSPLTKAQMQQVNKLNPQRMFNELYAIRKDFFTNHSNTTFIKGWLNRLDSLYQGFLKEAPSATTTGLVSVALVLIVVGAFVVYRYGGFAEIAKMY